MLYSTPKYKVYIRAFGAAGEDTDIEDVYEQ